MADMILDPKIEAEFLASILQDKDVVDADVLASVEPGYFSVESYQWLVQKLIDREWKPIAADYLDQELLSVPEEESQTKYRTQLSTLFTRELTFVEDASDRFRAYMAYCIMQAGIRLKKLPDPKLPGS